MGPRMRTQAKSVETEVGGEGRKSAVEAQQQESKLASKLVDTRWRREALEISIGLRYAQARPTKYQFGPYLDF